MRLINIFFIVLLVWGCGKEHPDKNIPEIPLNQLKLLALNEGLFQQNNASLSLVNLTTGEVFTDVFSQVNNRLLGDTGNDLMQYGGKLYVVVNNSNTVEVLDAKTLFVKKQISMQTATGGKQPRNISCGNGKVFVTCFDGFLDVIDTTSLLVEKRIPVGLNPEDVLVTNDKIVVSNSGGLNFPTADSTLSVIDLNTLTELGRITVGKNPGMLIADDAGFVYVIARGNYGSIPSRMVRVDLNSFTSYTPYAFDVSAVYPFKDHFIVHAYNYTSHASVVSLFDPVSQAIVSTNFIDASQFTTLYGVFYSTKTDRIYCTDAMNYTNSGYIKQFNSLGQYETSYHVGLNPNKMLLLE